MTPGLLDPIRPYLALVRVCLYAVLLAFLFVSGCNHGKKRSKAKIDDLKAQVEVCQSANRTNLDTIKELTAANEAYARQSAEQAKKLTKAQKDLKAAEKRAQAELATIEKELANARKDNADWAGTRVPDDYIRMLKRPGQD